MELARITYSGNNKKDTFLAIILGKHNGLISCLKSQHLSGEDIIKLGANKDQLNKLDLQARILWCKKNLSGFGAYRTLSESRAKIEETYG